MKRIGLYLLGAGIVAALVGLVFLNRSPSDESQSATQAETQKLLEATRAQAGAEEKGSKVVLARGGVRGADPVSPLSGGGGGGGGGDLAPLSTVAVPMPVGGDIIDRSAAVRLGKAFFWDVQAGGDGQVACATCHFQAGADVRHMNTVNPGPNNKWEIVGLGGMYDGRSFNNDDRVGSQGVVGATFVAVNPNPAMAADQCTPDMTAPFMNLRRVTGRQAPPAIGAVYNRDNFWDGRANHLFNGSDPFGATGNVAPLAAVTNQSGKRSRGGGGGGHGPQTQVENASVASAAVASIMDNSSLASQADGPPGSSTEMSCGGRAMNGPNSLGSKLLARPALQFQQVNPRDSVLGGYSMAPGMGMKCGTHACTYRELIEAAYGPALAGDAENQFSRLWGQAVQAYEATLIPDQTPFDRYMAGNHSALTDNQVKGLGVFTGKGGCIHCHAGAELSDATLSFAAKKGLLNEEGGDQGFHNIGVRPTDEDIGRAGTGPSGVSFSQSGSMFDHGAFKTPMLRNVKLTPPYFHNGAKGTLADVVDFYSRGGDFPNPEKSNRIKNLGLDDGDKMALVDFLTNGLTDCRVEKYRAPFDHPSLELPNGPSMPAVGADGVGACP